MKTSSFLHKRKKSIFRTAFILIISFFFQIFLLEATVLFFPRFDKQPPYYLGKEKFDPSLSRINSVNSFISFCDSLNGGAIILPTDSGRYANMVARVIKYRFVHGYTWYHLGQNYMATILAPLVHRDLSAIVVPDDILKYPKAACSQQSLIGMHVLKDKGFIIRKVGFYDSIYGGHFCYEAKYNGSWHFFDPNREPDENILLNNGRPSIEYLNHHKDILIKAYPHDSAGFVTALYSTYSYGKEGKIPGGNAILFQTATKFLSYSLWIFFALLYLFLKKKFFTTKENG